MKLNPFSLPTKSDFITQVISPIEDRFIPSEDGFSCKKALAIASAFLLAGMAGFEPANAAVKVLCLTA